MTHRYKRSKLFIDGLIRYALVFRIFLSLAFIILLMRVAGNIHANEPGLPYSELAKFIVSGLVVIGLFYSVLSFEFSVRKSRTDKKAAKSATTFTAITAWHNSPLVDYSKNIKLFDKSPYRQLLFTDINAFVDFFEQEQQSELNKSVIGIFSYFETIGGAVAMDVINEDFIKRFFKSIFISYYDDWMNYILKRRIHQPTLWIDFTNLVERWKT